MIPFLVLAGVAIAVLIIYAVVAQAAKADEAWADVAKRMGLQYSKTGTVNRRKVKRRLKKMSKILLAGRKEVMQLLTKISGFTIYENHFVGLLLLLLRYVGHGVGCREVMVRR